MRCADTAITAAADAATAVAVTAAVDVVLGVGVVAAADAPAWARALVSIEALLPLGAIDVDELDRI